MIKPQRCLPKLFAALLLIITPSFSQQSAEKNNQPQDDDGVTNDARRQLQKVKEWSEAAEQHVAGTADESATKIAAWKVDELKGTLDFVDKIVAQPPKSVKRTLAKPRYQTALSLTDDEVQRGDLSRLLKKATLLHTDIALLRLESEPTRNLLQTWRRLLTGAS